MVGGGGYGMGYLLIFLREDEKLHRLSLPIHHIVEHETFDHHCAKTEHHHLTAVLDGTEAADEHRTADDTHVDDDQCLAKRDVVILVYHCRHNIGATSAAVVEKHDGKSCTGDHTSQHERHEVVAFAKELVEMSIRLNDNALRNLKEKRKGKGGVYGLGKEFPSEYLQCGNDEEGIDDEKRVLHRKLCGIEDDGSYTRNASSDNLIGKQEHGESKRVQHQAKRDVDVIPYFV